MRLLFDRPGYYELVGEPQSGKTTVALLFALRKLAGCNALFMTTSAEWSPDLTMSIVGERDVGLVVESVEVFFKLVSKMPPNAFVVLDSLATLQSDHPSATQIASSVDRHWAPAPCPVLVVNQDRYPQPPGGLRWRLSLRGTFPLVRYRESPFLLSELVGTSLWLTWAGGRPELRPLLEEERRLWLPVYDGGV